MSSRPTAVSFGIVVASLLTALSARAECVIVTAKHVLEETRYQLVFSGTVVAIDSTAEYGYRATFDVDRVWKGSVSKRFDLYVSPLAGEMPTFELGRHFVAAATKLDDPRVRQLVGLGGTDTVAFTPVACTDSFSLSPTFVQDLGPGKPPNQSAEPARQLDPVTDREAYAIYAVLVPKMWAGKGPVVLQRETVTSSFCDKDLIPLSGLEPEWEVVSKHFTQEKTRSRLLMPPLPIPYRFISRADIEADDARLALKYPGTWQHRPGSIEYAAVSAVGFNAEKTKAMVYVGLRGSGTVYSVELREGHWVVAPRAGCSWMA